MWVPRTRKDCLCVCLPAGPSHLPSAEPGRRQLTWGGQGRRHGRRDGRYGTRPPLRRRVALGRGAGRARREGGAAAPTGRRGPGRTRANRKPPSLPNLIGSVFPFPPITDARAVFATLGLGEPACQSIAVLGEELGLLRGEGVRETEAPCQSLAFDAFVSLADYSGAFLLSATGESTAKLTAFRVKPRLLWELPSGFSTWRRSYQPKVVRDGERKWKANKKAWTWSPERKM